MKKEDLKVGMYIEFKGGSGGIVIPSAVRGEAFAISNTQSYLSSLDNLNDDLTNRSVSLYDVIRVYSVPTVNVITFSGKYRRLLYDAYAKPVITYLEDFKSKCPDFMINESGMPNVCVDVIYGNSKASCTNKTCTECWKLPLNSRKDVK
jgi:hypothetical protein